MSDQVGNPEDRFSQNEAQMAECRSSHLEVNEGDILLIFLSENGIIELIVNTNRVTIKNKRLIMLRM